MPSIQISSMEKGISGFKMINKLKNLAWIIQIRWIIFTARKRRKNYGWDNKRD